jgi:hypothetical protein
MHHQRATRGDGYAFLYMPTGKPATVQMGKISGARVQAWWFDPRSGTARSAGTFKNRGTREFDPPGGATKGNDWVLVLDDAGRKFGKPGGK